MPTVMAVQISIYLNEADEWQHRPLHIAILNYLKAENVAGATVIHAVAGFTGRSRVKTSSLVDAGGKLPIILTFIDTEDHVERVLPKLCEMAAHRLIVREEVSIEQGGLE
jgi:PII-like signaling protein